ncbi:hypothetical protein GON03_11120 [Nocardioides sp. MAH-18]|uniref:Oligosaccharide flippase family protein n=1 Tax=Nocardioides agri TaxID=2682843 RepID=A0A6L6XSJ1_9ACTN|nr:MULTISPECIES: hypothetical protein [unclassified Nocardioides]MBA2954879.1 hypothetical protein [Nocardioides sp. CGMCC 1.13656]MVQ49733.1 hypothetical protein [Nocardioides sp. MAH-18]
MTTEPSEVDSDPAAVAGPSGGFWGSALTYTIGALVLQGTNFLLTPVFTHVMTGAEMGRAVNYLFWSTMFGIAISLQLHGTLNNAVTHFGRNQLASFIRGVMPWCAVPAVALLVVLLAARGWWEDALGLPWTWLVLAVGNGVCIAASMMAIAQAVVTGRRVRYLLLTFLATVGGALVGLVLIGLLTDDALARVLGYVAGSVMVVAVLVPDVLGGSGRGGRVRGYLPYALPIALPLLAHELLWQVAGNANRVIVLRLENATEAGVFAYAATLGGVAALTAAAVNAAWTPWYFANAKAGADAATQRAARELIGGFGLLMTIAILVSPEVLRAITGRAFWGGDVIVPVFIAAGTSTFVFNVAANYLIYRRRTGLVLAVSAVGCALTLTLSVAAIEPWGATGVAVVSFLAAAVMALGAIAVGRVLGCRNLPQLTMAAVVVGTGGVLAGAAALADAVAVRFALAALLALLLVVLGGMKIRARRATGAAAA